MLPIQFFRYLLVIHFLQLSVLAEVFISVKVISSFKEVLIFQASKLPTLHLSTLVIKTVLVLLQIKKIYDSNVFTQF